MAAEESAWPRRTTRMDSSLAEGEPEADDMTTLCHEVLTLRLCSPGCDSLLDMPRRPEAPKKKRSRLAIVPRLVRSAVQIGVIPACALAADGCSPLPPVVAAMGSDYRTNPPVVAAMADPNRTLPPPVAMQMARDPEPIADAGADAGLDGGLDAGVDAGTKTKGKSSDRDTNRVAPPVAASHVPPPVVAAMLSPVVAAQMPPPQPIKKKKKPGDKTQP